MRPGFVIYTRLIADLHGSAEFQHVLIQMYTTETHLCEAWIQRPRPGQSRACMSHGMHAFWTSNQYLRLAGPAGDHVNGCQIA